MRDVNRIERIMNLLQQIWLTAPDMRFPQLMDTLQHEFSKEKPVGLLHKDILLKPIGDQTYIQMKQPDLFYVEDELFEEFLKEWLNNRK